MSEARPAHSALLTALSGVLPSEQQTVLLRACLLAGEPGREAWADFHRNGPDLLALLRSGTADARRLGPLLFRALRGHAGAEERALLTVLQTAYFREQLRSRSYLNVCGTVCAALRAEGMPFIVFRGAALGGLVYGDFTLRHSHDVNILVPEDALQATGAILLRCGCSPRATDDADARTFDHESGLPVLVHSRFFRISFYRADWDGLWARSEAGEIAGEAVRVLSPADALLHACCQSAHSLRPGALTWAVDAHRIIHRHPELDWTAFGGAAVGSRTSLPVYVAMSYLAERLDAPVPAPALTELDSESRRSDPAARDVALLLARHRRRSGVRGFLQETPKWTDALTRLKWLLLPSREYVEWAYAVPPRGVVPLYYVRRLLRFVRRGGARRLRNLRAASREGLHETPERSC